MDIEPTLTDSHEYALLVNQLPQRRLSNELKSQTRLAQLAAAVAYRAAADELVARLVDECANDARAYNSPTTWDRIGAALGVTKQAASQFHKRWLRNRGAAA